MKTIKTNSWRHIPEDFTGLVEFENGDKIWFKNGLRHREDGYTVYYAKGDCKEWFLEGEQVWSSSYEKLDLNKIIILSKEQHPLYPTVQVWKILDKDETLDQEILPGMEECIIE